MKSASNRIQSTATASSSPPPAVAGAPAPQGAAPEPAAQPSGSAKSARGTVRGRLAQLLDIKKVQHDPAVSVPQWDEASTLEICERWTQGQRSQPSIAGLARLAALNFERARPDSIPAELKNQRLLPEGAGNEAYYREMIATFLKTVGLDDADAAIDSFKKAGTGSLHRQYATASSLAGGAFGVAQLAASANLPAKTALSAVQLLMTALTTELGFESANLRFRNSGTEEIMPAGKADASPSAKAGPHVMQAAGRVAWDLHKVGHAVRKMERAQADFDDARARLSNPAATAQQRKQAEKDLHAAGQALSIAHARYCMRAQLKADYKSASESAKIEYHGNKRALGVGVASSAASITATVLGVLTPVVVSAAVTAGATAAAVALAATLYVGYQLSAGPSKDGEDKAKRAIVALAKSIDWLAGNAAQQQKDRADAYRTYISEKRTFAKPQVRKQAKAKLLATLDEIARRDTVKDDLDPVKNWKDYAAFRGQVAASGADEAAVQALEEAFTQAHASQFKTSTVSGAWKTPERMRFDSMGRVLAGKVTASLVSLHEFNERGAPTHARDPRLASATRAQLQGRRAEVKASLRDWLHFELAQSRMKAALAEKDPAQARATLQMAAKAMAAIENPDARDLFSPDARKQVEATERAKASTIGERERYTMTNAGPAALAGAVNAFGAAAGFGLTVEKDIAVGHGIHPQAKFGDQNDARVLVQGSAPVTAPYSAAERARFQKTGMSKLVDTIKRDTEPVVLKVDLAAANAMLIDLNDRHNDAALDKLLAAIEATNDVPDEIQFSIGGAKLSSAKLSGTTGYYDWRYRQAPLAAKAKFVAQKVKMFADSVRVSVASPVAQAIAQIPLTATRRAVDRGNEMNAGVRERLTEFAARKENDESQAAQDVPVASEPPQEQAVSAERDSMVHGDAPVTGDAAARADTPLPSETPADGDAPSGSEASTRRDVPAAAAEPNAPAFDPRAAALALRDIPELGHSARATHGDTPAARPEAAFRPRPAHTSSADPADERRAIPALTEQRDMMMGTGRAETLQWFEQHGIRAAYNSGHGMDCLIISLLQHATGRYGPESEPELVGLAARYRAQLTLSHPEIEQGDRMLYDDEPALEALIRSINRDYQADMNVQLITPSTDGPVRFQTSALGSHPVGVVMFGNHFQAVHRPADEAPEAGAGAGEAEAEHDRPWPSPSREARDAGGDTSPRTSLGPRALSRDDESRMSGLAAQRARTRAGASQRTSETPDEAAFVRTPKRDAKSARRSVKSWLSASPHPDAMEQHEDDGFVSTPKRDSKSARKNVKAWLSASPLPDPVEQHEGNDFIRTPKRNKKAAREKVDAWLSALPEPGSMDRPEEDGFVPTPKRDSTAVRNDVNAWLQTNRGLAPAYPINAGSAARTPGRGGQAASPEGGAWWEAVPDPNSDEAIAQRIKATFDSALDPKEEE
ncbi:type III effector protein [Trinickia dabaoshanensis]|uniref:Type III effector protein n=1 Tax=Trinickia dabaoshanensis TaxID=564714 RepID=A0A2N7VY01_9BURK|nr:type III effector protein [Trinickia dabaoshanensis]PMS22032.1 type III effector protein [Trinickia dabaoshanensis]